MDQLRWQFVHLLLFVFWLGADVGVWLAMWFVRDGRLSFETRATIIRLAFWIDLAPRCAFALMIPVGAELARGLGVFPPSSTLRAGAWAMGLAWCALHVTVLLRKGTPLAARLRRINVGFEAAMGIGLGAVALAALLDVAAVAHWPPWFAVKVLLFGAVFLVVLGIDTRFQPFTMLLATSPRGPTPEQQLRIRRATDLTLAWALLLYALLLAIAYLGKLKPFGAT
ncbi:MAG: hypothetical protein NZM12_06165 [Steroidobacteraceae bacterium]|nr:hypothetical protein [Steroidobacteraceae bacterium]MDW8259077.1 hypothetical protein [Gammaproteobacteria bacterium]